MAVLALSAADVHAALDPATCVEAMEAAFRDLAEGRYRLPLRLVSLAPDGRSAVAAMPAVRDGAEPVAAVKEIVVIQDNPTRGLDPHQGVVILHLGPGGRVAAILDATAVTELRTAAVSAVATRVLARPAARRVAILGAGGQARAHVKALRAVLDEPTFTIWGRTAATAERLAEELGASVAVSAERAVRGADVVCTVTSSSQPILRRAWLADGAHVNAVGASIRSARELDTATMCAATLVVDRRESALAEAGDYVLAAAEGAIGPEHVRAELGDVLTGRHPGRTRPDELTVFKSVGLAIEDLAAAEACVRRARERGLGVELAW